MKILISAGADVNKVDNEGYSALMIAAGMGDTNVIEQLIKAGANVNASTQSGHTALNLMIGGYDRYQIRHIRPDAGSIQLLLNAGADVNAAGYEGRTALHSAVSKKDVTAMKILLQAGAKVNKADNRGVTPLIRAAFDWGQISKVVEVLISAGADVNAVDDEGCTALHQPFFRANLPAIRSFIQAGADVNRLDNSGNTPLSSVRDADCARELLAGAQINRTTPNALHRYITGYHFMWNPSSAQKICVLLFAAGETIDSSTTTTVPEYLLFDNLKLNLEHLCREAIRQHLLQLDPHTHLFSRVPRLGLPSQMNDYLLYDVTCGN